jgi:hypothetical protein
MDLKIGIMLIREIFSSYLNKKIIHENKIRENQRNDFLNKLRNIYISLLPFSKINP